MQTKNMPLVWKDYPYFCNMYIRRTKNNTYYLMMELDAINYPTLKNATSIIRHSFPEDKVIIYGSFRDDSTKDLKQSYSVPITYSTVDIVEKGYKNVKRMLISEETKEYNEFRDCISEFIMDILNA